MRSIILLTTLVTVSSPGFVTGEPARGPLRVSKVNPRYFTDGSGGAVYLTGSHVWNNLVDMGPSDPPPKFDFDAYLEWLVRRRHNFIRLWTWELVRWDTAGNSPRHRRKRQIHTVAPHPWARVGPGKALDGKPRFDLRRFDREYFERLRSRVEAAGKRGIYVSVMLFEGWGVQRIADAWKHHPFHPENNVSGIDGDHNGDGKGLEIHTLANREVTRIQEAYVRQVIDTVNDLDNVLFEISNENHPPSTEWQYHMIRFIHGVEREKPKQHPVGMTFQFSGGSNRALLESPAEWISPNHEGGYRDDPPAADGKKVILSDTDHLWGIGGSSTWVWKSFLRGLNPIFMDPYDGLVLGDPDRAGFGALRRSLGATRALADRLDLLALEPRPALASTRYCLAQPGVQYVVYSPAAGDSGEKASLTVKLRAGTYELEWIRPDTGVTVERATLESAAGECRLEAPLAGAAVLHLRARTTGRREPVAPARGDGGITRNQESAHARLRSVDLAAVRWTDGFWSEQFRKAVDVTLPRLWELAADPEAGHAWQNLRIAAGLERGERSGTDWQDAWLYKWLESAAQVWGVTRAPELDRQMDRVIAVIARAQEPDGYLATQTQLRGDLGRYAHARHHELYTMGHLITAACLHHRITRKTNFLEVARKVADHVHDTFTGRDPGYADFPRNPSIIMAGVELYRTTGVKKYLDMARFFVDWRGSRYGTGRRGSWGPISGGSDLNQNWRPLRKETEVVGHAVFFTYLFAGAADVYMETGDESLLQALDRLWRDLTEKKMYITGGVGAMHKAHPVRSFHPGTLNIIVGDSIHEGVGAPYQLPLDTAYNETCGQIGNLMWNWRMLAITGDARFADVMEQSLYNSILSGVGISGQGWSYTNPLRWHGAEHVLLSQDAHERFDPGVRHICCPTNLLRTVVSWHGYLYTADEEGLWVHHYGGNALDLRLRDGRRLRLTQKTRYPWEGRITLAVDAVEGDDPLALRLRIPGWARDPRLTVNGEPAERDPRPGRYAVVKRRWRAGDRVELDLPMPVRMMAAHPRVQEARNHAAVVRGPMVYCLESTDLPADVRIEDVHLPRDATFTARHEPDLLGGVTVLETGAEVIAGHDGSAGLYHELPTVRPRPLRIRLIPYYAWNNRGEPKMTVWLPLR